MTRSAVRFFLCMGCVLLAARSTTAQPIPPQHAAAVETLWQAMWTLHTSSCVRHSHDLPVTVPGAARQQWIEHTLVAADYEANTRVQATSTLRPLGKAAASTASITVNYTNFPGPAQTAFQFAADIWETHISSPVTIVVDAAWVELDQNVLGSAGTTFIEVNQPYLPKQETWYPIALVEALAGRNVTGTSADIRARFNSSFPNWYFGVDGNTPTGTYDFATVVLHEIGHGLGFFDGFDYDDGDNSNGDECPGGGSGVGCRSLKANNGQVFPVIFDRFLETPSGVSLISLPTPSTVLGTALRSPLVFDGETVRIATGDIPVDLYAPTNFEPGSSIAHLDEQTFPAGSPNSLMTPQLARAESIFSPGAITCAIFRDIGWTLGPDCDLLLGADILEFAASVTGNDATLVFRTGPVTTTSRVEIVQQYFDDAPEVVASVPVSASQVFEVRLENLPPGRYRFQLRLVQADNTVMLGPEEEVSITLRDLYSLRALGPNPIQGQTRFALQVRSRQSVEARLYNAVGQLVALVLAEQELAPNTREFLEIDGGALAAGVYFLRVQGETFVEVRQLVVLQ